MLLRRHRVLRAALDKPEDEHSIFEGLRFINYDKQEEEPADLSKEYKHCKVYKCERRY